ncbi:membrane alanyl aminopeptidase-like [Agrilus planipennis]|uniref:Aminopeptidase n=1 Tax=Agrilus planipennis TaxID=224129 RepID=A0A7F5R7X9_AGRPL|nr:membrane alanyl aminopeptidase-like [Agrilus planipennis]
MAYIFYFASLLLVVYPALAQDPYRLGISVFPIHYDVELTLPSGFGPRASFSGRVEIGLETKALVTIFDLHSSNLTYSSLKLYDIDDPSQSNMIVDYRLNTTYGDKLWIELSDNLVVGNDYILTANYTGILHDDMNGFYRSSYKDANKNTRWLATTQFQSTYARRAFPCFDEPKLKASYDISIIHPQDVRALSNTPVMSREVYNQGMGLVKTTFQQTPNMSTYLVAFVVSDFIGLTDTSNNYGVYAAPYLINTTRLALDVGPKLLKEMETFINFPYSNIGIGKLDLVAIPDFASGAMENWGLGTFSETELLYDQQKSTLHRRRTIPEMIMRQTAYMWFGDLVTCDWWSFLWLNDGFATYFEYFGTAQKILAAAIIRMVRYILGNNNWRQGLIDYISQNQYVTGTPDLLYAAWSTYSPSLPSGLTLATILSSWADVGGYPLVKVSLSGNDAVISQKQFLLDPSESSSSQWYVPLTYTTSLEKNFDNTTTSRWLIPGQNVTISNILQGGSGWVLLNLQQTAVLTCTERIMEEAQEVPKRHVLNLMDPLYKSVSFARNSSESYVDVQKKSYALFWACTLRHPDCIQKAQNQYSSLVRSNTPVNPDVRSVVYCTGLRFSNNSADWYFLWNKLTQETLPSEIDLLMNGLGCSRNESLLNEYMNNALNSSNGVIRKHDVSSAFLAIYSSNLEGINITLNYIQNNYQKIIDYFDGTSTLLGILSDMVNRMTTESQIRKLESWISANSNSLSSISSEVQSYIANARSNLALEQQIATELYNFFNSS